MKKLIALFALLMTVGAGLCSIVSKIQPNNLLLSSLALSNLEALAQNENGLSDGWVQGRKMDQVWLVATASFSAGISAGSNGIVSTKVEGGVTSVNSELLCSCGQIWRCLQQTKRALGVC